MNVRLLPVVRRSLVCFFFFFLILIQAIYSRCPQITGGRVVLIAVGFAEVHIYVSTVGHCGSLCMGSLTIGLMKCLGKSLSNVSYCLFSHRTTVKFGF